MIALFLGLATGLRFHRLDLDPQWLITGGPSPNEGLYLHNARNRAVEGVWKPDDWNSRVIFPVASAAQAATFRFFETGLVPARRLTALLATASLVLFALLVYESSGPLVALAAVAFLGFDPVFLTLSRTANPAPMGIFLMMATIALWRLSVTKIWLAPIAGMCLVVSSVVENAPHDLFFAATAFLAMLMVRLQAWKMPWSGRARGRVRLFGVGAATALLAWGILLAWPMRDDLARMLNTPLGSLRPGNIPINLFLAPFIFGRLVYWMPVIIMIALTYVLVFARSLFAPIARHRPLSETRVWFFAWLLTGPLFMAIRADRPLGALVLLTPPICFAAAEALVALLRIRELKKPDLDVLVVLGLLTFVVWTAVQGTVHGAVLTWNDAFPSWFFEHQFRHEFMIVILIAAPLVVLVSRLWLRWRRFSVHVSPVATAVVFSALSLFILSEDFIATRLMFRTPREVLDAAGKLKELPQGSVIAGTWAPLLALDAGHRSLVIWPGMNDGAPPAALGVTHFLIQKASREEVLAGQSASGRLVRMETFPIGIHRLDLYRRDPSSF